MKKILSFFLLKKHAFKKYAVITLKIAIFLLITKWIIGEVHWHDYVIYEKGHKKIVFGMATCIGRIRLYVLLSTVFLMIVSKLLNAIRWKVLLNRYDNNLNSWCVFELTFLSDFISTCFPSALSGDIVKAYVAKSFVENKLRLYVGIIIDRFSGLWTFYLTSLIATLFAMVSGINLGVSLHPLYVLFSFFILGTVGLICLIVLRRQLVFLFKIVKKPFILTRFRTMFVVLGEYIHDVRLILILFGISFISQLMVVVATIVIGIGLHIQIPFYMYFIYVPLVTIISAVPLTPGGVGVTEGLYLYFFSPYASGNVVLVFAILVRFVIILSSMPGAFFVNKYIDFSFFSRKKIQLV